MHSVRTGVMVGMGVCRWPMGALHFSGLATGGLGRVWGWGHVCGAAIEAGVSGSLVLFLVPCCLFCFSSCFCTSGRTGWCPAVSIFYYPDDLFDPFFKTFPELFYTFTIFSFPFLWLFLFSHIFRSQCVTFWVSWLTYLYSIHNNLFCQLASL